MTAKVYDLEERRRLKNYPYLAVDPDGHFAKAYFENDLKPVDTHQERIDQCDRIIAMCDELNKQVRGLLEDDEKS